MDFDLYVIEHAPECSSEGPIIAFYLTNVRDYRTIFCAVLRDLHCTFSGRSSPMNARRALCSWSGRPGCAPITATTPRALLRGCTLGRRGRWHTLSGQRGDQFRQRDSGQVEAM